MVQRSTVPLVWRWEVGSKGVRISSKTRLDDARRLAGEFGPGPVMDSSIERWTPFQITLKDGE